MTKPAFAFLIVAGVAGLIGCGKESSSAPPAQPTTPSSTATAEATASTAAPASTDSAAPTASAAPTSSGGPVLGGDRDAHGCIGSAGYRWCAKENACVRPWELAKTKGLANNAGAVDTYCGH